MPAHLAIYDGDGLPAPDITIAMSGGQESAIFVRQIWNDKDDALPGTTTAVGAVLALLANVGAGAKRYGLPMLDERWFRARVTGALGTSEPYVTATQPLGTNSDLMLGDIPPGGGVEIELQAFAPGVGGATAATITFDVDGFRLSATLSKHTTLATGAGVVPPDRVPGLLALLSGGDVTANDTATLTIARGKLVSDGTIIPYPATTSVMTLADGGAVNLGAGEDYHVTLSRSVAAPDVVVVTKGLKAEETLFPDVPAGNVLVANLNVASADGVAVTVAQSSVIEPTRYGAFSVRAGTGLAVTISRGESVTASDLRQFVQHEDSVPVVASSTNRVWQLGNGSAAVTQTDAEPEFGVGLMALAITDAGAVTSVVDMRRFTHRGIVTFPVELVWRGVLTALVADQVIALAYAYDDLEIEAVEQNVTGLDAGLTGGALKLDILTVAPGLAVPFPTSGAGGTTIFTSFATDDARPSIAFDATVLRVITEDHEVRRHPKGTRFLAKVVTTVTGPGAEPEQEIRVTLHARRYR